ncbi:uncharacterized protein [Amphiura filiformis]|uniref:uncharacterized protein n=1 Tax=Amphiura filiformis TaxID=82378 RepID=UPI003B220872
MVTKRCAWGVCKSDSRYKDRDHMKGVWFVPFPKPKSQREKCLRWVKACGRPHDQLNVDRIREHHFVCSKHFPGGNGPSTENPDPNQAEPTNAKKARYPHKRRSDSPPPTDATPQPKMSRECAAEALLALKVAATSSLAYQAETTSHLGKVSKTVTGSIKVHLRQPVVIQRDKTLMVNGPMNAIADVKAV